MGLLRRIVEFFTVPSWARTIINKYRELLGEENVVYTILDRNHVIISYRKGGVWYRSYCTLVGIVVTCFDESTLVTQNHILSYTLKGEKVTRHV